jgi:hypothetical protein
MAKQVIDISTANSGQGTPLRSAFDMINDNFTELYTDDAGDVNSITATAPIARDSATGDVTISLTDGGISTQKIADDAVTNDKLANAINSAITANTAKVTNATHSGDVTGATALTIASGAVTVGKMAANSVDSDQYVDASIDTAHFSLTAAINVNVDQNTGTLKLWSGSQAQYNALTPDASTIYFIV